MTPYQMWLYPYTWQQIPYQCCDIPYQCCDVGKYSITVTITLDHPISISINKNTLNNKIHSNYLLITTFQDRLYDLRGMEEKVKGMERGGEGRTWEDRGEGRRRRAHHQVSTHLTLFPHQRKSTMHIVSAHLHPESTLTDFWLVRVANGNKISMALVAVGSDRLFFFAKKLREFQGCGVKRKIVQLISSMSPLL